MYYATYVCVMCVDIMCRMQYIFFFIRILIFKYKINSIFIVNFSKMINIDALLDLINYTTNYIIRIYIYIYIYIYV